MNRIALALLIAAAVCYGLFLITPGRGIGHGWEVWNDLWRFVRRGHWMAAPWQDRVSAAAFLAGGPLAVAGPLLMPLLCRLRALWWVVVLLTAATGAGFSVMALKQTDGADLGLAFRWLIASQAVALVGLLCVRDAKPGH